MTDRMASGNSLVRSLACERCGARMLWTQAAWHEPDGSAATGTARAAYRCDNGHVIDPADTPQCPKCGVHDTASTDESTSFKCRRCSTPFSVPR